MEQLLEKMQACRRQLELEDRLPAWERQLQERKAQISEMTENLKQKEQALEKLGNPGFLQRLSGKTGVQKERICISSGKLRQPGRRHRGICSLWNKESFPVNANSSPWRTVGQHMKLQSLQWCLHRLWKAS